MAKRTEVLTAVESKLVTLAITKFKSAQAEATRFMERAQAEFNAETVVINEAHALPQGTDVVFNLDDAQQMVLLYDAPNAPTTKPVLVKEDPLN